MNSIDLIESKTIISDRLLVGLIPLNPGGVLTRISDRGVPRRFVNPNPI